MGVTMAFSGQVAKVLHHLYRRTNITKSSCSPPKCVCKGEGLGGHLQKGTLSLLSPVLWALRVSAAGRERPPHPVTL